MLRAMTYEDALKFEGFKSLVTTITQVIREKRQGMASAHMVCGARHYHPRRK